MKYFLLLLLLLGSLCTKAADNSRSDTIDVLHQTIVLNITDYVGHTISGSCHTNFKAKMNGINQLLLDLKNFTIDSVTQNNATVAYTYDQLLLTINLSSTLNQNDTAGVTVYYHGAPAADATWGGFYWSGVYAYNLGVAFTDVPHNFGRAWFPCFDNFVERSTYTLVITTPGDKMDMSNGTLVSSTLNGDGTKTWTWEMNQPIPSYLLCVTVAGYTPVNTQYTSVYGPTIPVMLAALPADTTNMKNSFVHLTNALQTFEQHFGPYVWEKVGYVAVPFSGGAMEHASCISYPVITLNGNTGYETIMAHELSHHWFGDLVTCETAEDMWLNEGWAVYCEHIFTEALYGDQAYADAVKANHEKVLHYAHIDDGGYHPLSGMPQNVTYGTTTYKKGADVAHTLRTYMGDSVFFSCVKNYLTDNAFQHSNSAHLHDYLSQCSDIDLTNFFDDWVFSPGFADFNIDSFAVTPSGGTYDVQVFVRQKLNHAPHLYNNVPLELTFMNAAFDTVIKHISMSGPCGSFVYNVPFNPAFVGLDMRDKISDSNVGDSKVISQTGANNFVNGKMNLTVTAITDSAFLRIEHHYAPPDPIIPAVPNLTISDYRYWQVDGVLPAGFDASATLQYNGSNNITTGGYLDNNLMTNSEDSVVLLYRSGIHHAWSVVTDIVKTIGIPTDKKGIIKINHLQLGEYALAIYDYDHTTIPVFQSPDSCSVFNGLVIPESLTDFAVFPSPADDVVHLVGNANSEVSISVYNILGVRILQHRNINGHFNIALPTSSWSKGIYFVTASANGNTTTQKFAVIH